MATYSPNGHAVQDGPDHDAKVVEVPQKPRHRAVCHACIWRGPVRTFKAQADSDLWDHLHRGRK